MRSRGNEQIAAAGTTLEALLHLERQTLHALPRMRVAQHDPRTRTPEGIIAGCSAERPSTASPSITAIAVSGADSASGTLASGAALASNSLCRQL